MSQLKAGRQAGGEALSQGSGSLFVPFGPPRGGPSAPPTQMLVWTALPGTPRVTFDPLSGHAVAQSA